MAKSRKTSDATDAARATLPRREGPVGRTRPQADPEEEAAFASVSPERRNHQRGYTSTEAIGAARSRMAGRVNEDEPPPVRGFSDDQEAENEQPTRSTVRDFRRPPPAFNPFQPPPQPPPSAMQGAMPIGGGVPVDPQFAKTREAQLMKGTRAQTHPNLSARFVTPHDVDRLWDWIRQDDSGQEFFNRKFDTSMELHAIIMQLRQQESVGLSIFRAFYWDEEHFGFLMVSPILAEERTALVHTYLRPDAQANIGPLLASVCEIAAQLVPNVHLAIPSPGENWDRQFGPLLGKLGFARYSMFIR